MVPKRAFRCHNTFKVQAYLFNKFKRKPFKRRSSGLNISVSRLDVPVSPFMPVFPQQHRCDRIRKSVVGLSSRGEQDPSADRYYIMTPVMIFKAVKGSCCLVYGDCGFDWTDDSRKLIFPNKQIVELPIDVILREKTASIHNEEITLVALSCETREPSEPFQAIEFGENVEMNQLVFLFDFRYRQPSVTQGTVAYADLSHFILDARPHDQYWYGALVFDVNDKLVGLVYSHAGSPKAIQVNYLKPLLAEILPEQMMPRRLGRNPSLRDVPSPPQPHADEEEAALHQEVQASTMAAAADMTLDFPKNKLDDVYAKLSPFIVSVRKESGPDAVGFVIRQTSEHYKIAVQTFAMRSEAKSVRFANKKVSPVDKVQEINTVITILYVKWRDGDPLLDEFDDADPSDNVCEKVVTFIPYMDGIAMFKGHIILNDSTSRTNIPAIDFTFTCPYASSYELEKKDMVEKTKTLLMTVGAPIFNLEGFFLGVLTYSGREYDVKFAMTSRNFYNQLPKGIMDKKSNSKDERKDMKNEHEEEDGTKGSKGKKSKSKDETKHRKAKHKEDGMKGANKGKKSNSKGEGKHRKDRHEEEDGQYSVGSDVAHCLMVRHDDTPMIDKETHRLTVVNMDKRGKDSVEDKLPEFDLSQDERSTDPRCKRSATLMRKQVEKKGAGTSDC